MSDALVWQLIRASGLSAYVLLSAAMFVGVAVRVRALDWLMRRAWAFEGHQTLSVLALAFTGQHMFFLLVHGFMPFGVVDVLVPFASSYSPFAVALGILTMYVLVLLVATSFARPAVPQRIWRSIHYSAFAAWFMALGHGLFAGSDTDQAWVQWMYLATAAAVGFLVLFRFLEGGAAAEPAARRVAARRG